MPRLRKCGRLPSLQRRMRVDLLIPVIRAISLGGTGCSSCCRLSRTVLIPAAMAGVNEGSTSSGEGSTAPRRLRRFVSPAPLGRPRLRACWVTCIVAILMSPGPPVNSTKVMNRMFVLANPFWRISQIRALAPYHLRRYKGRIATVGMLEGVEVTFGAAHG